MEGTVHLVIARTNRLEADRRDLRISPPNPSPSEDVGITGGSLVGDIGSVLTNSSLTGMGEEGSEAVGLGLGEEKRASEGSFDSSCTRSP
jgi:hypothetical protein